MTCTLITLLHFVSFKPPYVSAKTIFFTFYDLTKGFLSSSSSSGHLSFSHFLLPPHSLCLFVFLTFLCPLTLTSCCSSSLPRVSIDPAKRQTAKTGPAVPSTQGGKTLSKSAALQSLSAFPSLFPSFRPFFSSFLHVFILFLFFGLPSSHTFKYSLPPLSLSFLVMCLMRNSQSPQIPILSFRFRSRRYREL